MSSVIKDIWYGKLQSSAEHVCNKKEILELHKKNVEMSEGISSALNDEGKKLLESLLDNYFELIDLLQADAFVKGFKLGGKLAREIFD